MDTMGFDVLTMQLATGRSRRQILRWLAGGAGGLLAVGAAGGSTRAQSCAGIQESCADLDCCEGYGCDENGICIAAAECADFGEGCLTDEQCCGAYFCGETGTCIAAAECAEPGQRCKIDENCCGDLICDESGTCVNPGDESEVAGATELPGTGAGTTAASTSWPAGVAVAAAGAVLAGAQLMKRRDAHPLSVEADARPHQADTRRPRGV